jgi:hypothetical protein
VRFSQLPVARAPIREIVMRAVYVNDRVMLLKNPASLTLAADSLYRHISMTN